MKYSFLIVLIFVLSSCRSDNEDIITIIDYDKERLIYSVEAKDTRLEGVFTFTAIDNWSVNIEETTAHDSSELWIKVSPMSGIAGKNINLKIEMDVNEDKETRKVDINISSRGYTITLVIEQKGMQSEGIITSITLDYLDGSDNDTLLFNYNSSWQLISVEPVNRGQLTIDYTSEMIIERSNSSGGGSIISENSLNENGFVSMRNTIRTETYMEEEFKFTTTHILTYNDNGSLVKMFISNDNNGFSGNSNSAMFVWSDGNLAKKTIEENTGGKSVYVNNVSFSYTEYDNKANLDLNIPIVASYVAGSYDIMSDISALIRKTGESSKKLLSTVVDRGEDKSGFWDETKYRFEYKFNDIGYVTEIKRYFSFSYHSQPTENIPDERLDMIYKIEYPGSSSIN